LTMFTDGSRSTAEPPGNYSVVWKNGQSAWVVIKAHMGYNQEAYDAECAAVARALETASRGETTDKVTIFTARGGRAG